MCNCDNEKFGFNCMCDHEEKFPGKKQYVCEFCGIYTASQARCGRCEGGFTRKGRDNEEK